MPAKGVVAGIGLSLAAARVRPSFLFRLTPVDATTYMLVAIAIGGVATGARLMPVRRASAIDPVTAPRKA